MLFGLLVMVGVFTGIRMTSAQKAEPAIVTQSVLPGDTWAALALRYGLDAATLRDLNPGLNWRREPVIGKALNLPAEATPRPGQLVRPNDGGLLQTAVVNGLAPWVLAQLNELDSPWRPTLYRALYLPGEGEVRDLPGGFSSLEFSASPAVAGQALGLRGNILPPAITVAGRLDVLPLVATVENGRFLALVGAGAFFGAGEPELMIRVDGVPAWAQPILFTDHEWQYQELTLTGEAAQIDQAARDEERARLRELWTTVKSGPLWTGPFALPIQDYLEVSANYGARRAYNGGPYLTYHEGVDFSAWAGTPVTAPAAGTVVLAERLYVRGGAVIIDHGLGVYSGYYHLSAVHATPGQAVQPGDLLGEVGTTGLSTGNHLHWDLLVNGVWVDPVAWQAQGLDCWALEGLGRACN